MLEKCGWNQTEAAERFHVPLSTLNQKIKRLAIEIKKEEPGVDRFIEPSRHRVI
jgi:DNA-binding NtrC family response regulator